MSGTATLTRQGKAALILRLLLGEGQGLSLADMPEETQIALAREMGRLGSVDKDTIDQVAGEFADHLEKIGLGPAGGVSKVIDGLADFLSPEVAERMRNEARNGPPPEPWAYVLSLELSELEPIMERETIETAAVVLSRLPVAKAAPLLGLLPGERARRIAYAVSRIGTIAPQTVALIGAALSRAYTRPAQSAFPDDPSQRIGDILNVATASTRDDLLADIASNDPAFAEKVRKAIFTFADIPMRVAGPDISKILRAVEGRDLATALAHAAATGGADQAAVDHIFANLSQRMGEQIREEVKERGKVRKADGEQAQSAFVAAIRAAVDAGEIALREEEPEEES
jgi:flagellar motor switch protein FliG